MNRSMLTVFAVLLLWAAWPSAANACSCSWDLPESFCESMWYWQPPARPDVVVLVEKLDSVHHGMDMKVLEVLYGYADDTIRVWGDPGHLCRPYAAWFAVGDTFVMALDSMSSGGYDYEQAGDYQINICGVYYLSYSNGNVIGSVFENQQQTVAYSEFRDSVLVPNCNPTKVTGIDGPYPWDLGFYLDGHNRDLVFAKELSHVWVNIYDVSGRKISSDEVFSSKRYAIPDGLSGIFLVEVATKKGSVTQRVALY